jgi:hypothetical protein
MTHDVIVIGAGAAGLSAAADARHRNGNCGGRTGDRLRADLLLRRLAAKGVTCRENAGVTRVSYAPAGVLLELTAEEPIRRSHLLVATGRRPNVDGLRLICGAGRDAQAVSDDYQLASCREGLEGRFRNHSTGAAGTRREGLGAPQARILCDTEFASMARFRSRMCAHNNAWLTMCHVTSLPSKEHRHGQKS